MRRRTQNGGRRFAGRRAREALTPCPLSHFVGEGERCGLGLALAYEELGRCGEVRETLTHYPGRLWGSE